MLVPVALNQTLIVRLAVDAANLLGCGIGYPEFTQLIALKACPSLIVHHFLGLALAFERNVQ